LYNNENQQLSILSLVRFFDRLYCHIIT